jgi:hypothetical protein
LFHEQGRFPVARAKAADPTPPEDLSAMVHGLVRVYECPDQVTVDCHLVELNARVKRATDLPKLMAQYRADIDSLLDHRLWLEMTADSGDPCPRTGSSDASPTTSAGLASP